MALLSFSTTDKDQQFHSAFFYVHAPSHFPVRCAETSLRVLKRNIFLKQRNREFVTKFHQPSKCCTLTWLVLGGWQKVCRLGRGEEGKAQLEPCTGEMGGLGTSQMPNIASKC